MRKVLLLLIGIVVVIGCSTNDTVVPDTDDGTGGDGMNDQTDDDQGDMTEEETLVFSLEIIGQVIPDNAFLDLYVANLEGEIVGEARGVNDATTELKGQIEPGGYFTVSIVFRNFSSSDSFAMTTYIEPPVGTYVMRADSGANENCDYDQVQLSFRNSGHPVDILLPPYLEIDLSDPANGGSFEISPYVCDPGRFYGVFRSASEDDPRYFFSDALVPGQSFEIDYSKLSVPDHMTNTNLPYEIRGGVITCIGIRDGYSHLLHDFYMDVIPMGYGVYHDFDLYYPDQFFDLFSTYATIIVDEAKYSMWRVGDPVIGDLDLSPFAYTIDNTSMDDFRMSTTGPYDYYSVGFSFVYGGRSRTFSVRGPTSEEVSFKVEQLARNIFMQYPELDGIFPAYDTTILRSYSYVDGYSEVVQFLLDNGEIPKPEAYISNYFERIDY